ncbi:MAG: PilZ domain-containing protein [Planctomycetota bacterium]
MTHRHDNPKREIRPTRILLAPRAVTPDQKRAFDRTSTNRAVQATSEGESLTARLVNVSPTGLQLAVDRALAEGDEIEVAALPDRLLAATVRWTRDENDHVVLGAEWKITLPVEDVWRIRAIDDHPEA